MKNNSIISDHQLIDYVKGAASAEEKQQVEEWLARNSDNQIELDRIKAIWQNAGSLSDFDAIDLTKNWIALQAKINESGQKAPLVRYLWRYAAAIVLLAVVTFLIMKPREVEMQEMTASISPTNVTLADGTQVWLKDGATLIYPESFSADAREVSLIGEAFFEVTHNPEHPFIVTAGDTKTEVLGTSFNINKGEGNLLELTLITGKVRFVKGDQQALLTPGQKINVSVDGMMLKSINSPTNFMSWRTRKLTFENTPMEAVLGDISRLYGVVLEIMDKDFLKCPLTTTFENETIEEVLDTIAALFNIDIQQNGQHYQLMGKGCKG